MTFTEWMAKVNETVEAKAGISVYDLADYAFRDAYDSRENAEDVAIDVLSDNDFPDDTE